MRFNLMKRKFLTEKELKRVSPGSPYYVEKGTYLTPLAQEVARQRNNAIIAVSYTHLTLPTKA